MLNDDFQDFIQVCQTSDNTPDTNELLTLLVNRYQASYPDFVNSECFLNSLRDAILRMKKDPTLVHIEIHNIFSKLNYEFQNLLQTCRKVDNSVYMDGVLKALILYYENTPPDFAASDEFCDKVRQTIARITKNDPCSVFSTISDLGRELNKQEAIRYGK